MTDNVSTPSQKPAFNKREFLNDVFSFLAIVGAYQFISLTYRVTIFQSLLGLKFDSYRQIVVFFLYYALIVVFFKTIIFVITFIKKVEGEHSWIENIRNIINESLLMVFFTISLCLLSTMWKEDEEFTIAQLCHLSAWLFFAQISTIISSLFICFESLRIFGRTIEIIVILGLVGEMMGLDIFMLI